MRARHRYTELRRNMNQDEGEDHISIESVMSLAENDGGGKKAETHDIKV